MASTSWSVRGIMTAVLSLHFACAGAGTTRVESVPPRNDHATPPALVPGRVREPVFVEAVEYGALRVEKWRLPNGLRLLLAPDPAARALCYMTWFAVGSRDEDADAGQTGLAHLFEHLMFTQTENLAAGEFDARMEAVGGEVNAMTAHDFTAYLDLLPPGVEHLELAATLEADRMQALTLTEEQVETEREVVAEERLLSVEDSVDGTLEELIYARAFRSHPYRWPIIGWMKDIRATTRANALAFYRRHYAADNAVVVVTGRFERQAALDIIANAYGALAGRTTEIRPTAPVENAPVENARIEIERPIAAPPTGPGVRSTRPRLG